MGLRGGDLEARLKWLTRLKWFSRVNDTKSWIELTLKPDCKVRVSKILFTHD